jgi:hypothetical protein
MKLEDDPLVSRDVSMRQREAEKLKAKQQKQMNQRRVEAPSNAFQQSSNAHNDEYMKQALSKVRESRVTLPYALTRHNGTWIHNQK